MNLPRWLYRFDPICDWVKSAWFWVVMWAVVVLVAESLAAVMWWDWLTHDESGSAIIRNLFLATVAAIGLPLAMWRSWIAERQADSARHQADTAQRGLLNERYQKGSEMLGSNVLTVRLGGIYALKHLAWEHPEMYHVQIMQLFCAFICHPPSEEHEPKDKGQTPRVDIDAAIEAIGARDQDRIDLEKRTRYRLDLTGADLRNQSLHNMNLSRINFGNVNLSGTFLWKTNLSEGLFFPNTNLSNTNLSEANLSGSMLHGADLSFIRESTDADFSKAGLVSTNLTQANLYDANFEKANFTRANLAGAIFCKSNVCARGLTQQQIDHATADPKDNPPILDGLIDEKTGDPIVWKK